MLLAALREIHPSSVAIDLGISRDTPQDLEAKVKEGLSKADVLITTGGVSMGELDLMQPLLEKLGMIIYLKYFFQ
jgi:gephyrin